MVLATGLGKTVVMAEAVAQLYRDGAIPEERVLVMAGTRELVDQLQRSFWPSNSVRCRFQSARCGSSRIMALMQSGLSFNNSDSSAFFYRGCCD